MSFPWLRSRQSGSWRIDRQRPGGPGKAATIGIVVVAAIATVLLYRAAGHNGGQKRELVLRPAALAPATVGAQSANVVSPTTQASGAVPPALPPSAATPSPFTNDLLRPGTELVARVDLSLDASSQGQVAVTSRYTVTSGCQPLFADIYALIAGHWKPVFSATDSAIPYGPLLSEPEQAAGGCFPRFRLFSSQPGTAGNGAMLLIGTGYADGSARLAVVGWDANTGGPSIVFDWHTGYYGSISRSPDGNRVEIGEDAAPPTAIAALGLHGTAGRLIQTVMLDNGAPYVADRRIAPPCESGRIAAGTTRGLAVPETGRLLVLSCSSGQGISLAPEAATLAPAGITWADLRDGDAAEVEYDPASLQLADGAPALPRLATVTDDAALARHQASQKPAQTAPRSAPIAAPQQRPPPAVPAPRQSSAPQQSTAPRTSSAPQQSTAPRTSSAPVIPASNPTVNTAPRSAPAAAPPLPVVTPPPPPRAPPFAGPPAAPIPRGD